MKIKINGKTHKIKLPYELSVDDYIQLSKVGNVDIASYLSQQTGINYTGILNSKSNNRQINIILAGLSSMKTFTQYMSIKTVPKTILINNKLIETKSLNWDAVGARIAFEQRAKTDKNIVSLSVFFIACLLSKNFDNEESGQIYKDLLTELQIHVLPIAAFFLRKYLCGQRSGLSILKIIANWKRTQIYMPQPEQVN